MGAFIFRREEIVVEVEIPSGCEICSMCKGEGLVSKYDLGWSSVVHSEELAVKHECWGCRGLGYTRVAN